MRFGSVCSGIEAASVAWGPLGWQAAWLAEIEPFPAAVLAHHYPDADNLGDMTTIAERVRTLDVAAPEILCGGTPCQAFSVAGKRLSLDDARGNLSLVFCDLADAIDEVRADWGAPPTIIFWENVPGVLSTRDNAFGCFLAGLAGEDVPLVPPGGRWTHAGVVSGPARTVAWRTLDAQYFGLAQRRKRVFVVASARDDIDPAAILLEFEGVRRDSAPRREAGEGAARATVSCLAESSGHARPGDNIQSVEYLVPDVANCLTQRMHKGINSTVDEGQTPIVTHALRASGFDASEDGTGRGTPLVPVHAFDARQSDVCQYGDRTGPLDTDGHTMAVAIHENQRGEITINDTAGALNKGGGKPGQGYPAVAFQSNANANDGIGDDLAPTLRTGSGGTSGNGPAVAYTPTINAQVPNDTSNIQTGVRIGMQVRRLTPRECERLQGFPDDYTLIPVRGKPAADGPRYKALGNSWAVPVVRWIGERIARALA